MKIFLSWSGNSSRRIAEVFKQWLPQVIQDIQIFYSPDILRGTLWLQVLREELEDNSFGIFCVTPESLSSLWMSYEVGAIVSRNKNAKAVPLLFGLTVEDVKNTPYAPFQAVCYNRTEIYNLVDSINKSINHPLDVSILKTTFDIFWPFLEEKISERLPQKSLVTTPVRTVYEQADMGLFAHTTHELVRTARQVTLVGTGLCILSQDPIRMLLFGRARSGECNVRIYLGNPDSPNVQTRLIEEETGDWSPSVGYRGLINRAEMLLREWRQYGSPEMISLFMFDHYPTMAIIIIDDHYFFYPYGYATLGNFSPVLYLPPNDESYIPMRKFLDRQVELIRRNSLPLELLSQTFPDGEPHIAMEDTIPAAVYFIPPADSALYKFGSTLLGYDVYSGAMTPANEIAPVAPEVQGFGFHLTICDVLYFLKRADVEWLYAEVKFVAAMFKGFTLQGLHLEKNFPDVGTISFCVEDRTGNLEALHHELVHRLYRRSIGSNFTFHFSSRARGPFTKRDQLMIEKYHAPHILSAFRPHFTLLTDIPADKIDTVYDQVAHAAKQAQIPEEIKMDSLAVMGKAKSGENYTILSPLIRLL